MNTTFARLLSTVLFPVLVLAGAVGCHQASNAKDAAASADAPLTVLYDAPLVPKDRSDLAMYSARVDGESRTEIFVQGSDSHPARLVYVDPEPGELVQVSDDGTHGVYRRYISPGVTKDIVVNFEKVEG